MTCKSIDLGKWLLFLNQIFVQAFWGGFDYQILNYILEEFPNRRELVGMKFAQIDAPKWCRIWKRDTFSKTHQPIILAGSPSFLFPGCKIWAAI